MNRSQRQQNDGSADNVHPEGPPEPAAKTASGEAEKAPAPAKARPMKRKRPAKVDPLEREIELDLNRGAFIGDRACFQFEGELDGLPS